MPFYTYITTNPGRTTLYIGITKELSERLKEHYENRGDPETFAGRYYCYKLIYYETYRTAQKAIEREKELKKWRRDKKEILINNVNPGWKFLNYNDDFRVGRL
ncbi:endonuclease [Aliifodinibius salipaludis]|uniref:Endonuclease n=1 Tax=Fodinibius salipaludis TaxID=2032627 RepID=A0A2A2GBE1_9BACT|nr:GIY-YIG nuclease family protein [Aliifodinibius salipaludis]PAU94881.1 endonuclease [Aliifodinibius salipaludis]